jgi:hypothetical protein
MAEIRQAAAKPLLMRVQNAAKQKLAAGVDEFDFHNALNKESRNP